MNWFQEWALTLAIFLPAVGLAIILLLPKAEETAAKTGTGMPADRLRDVTPTS